MFLPKDNQPFNASFTMLRRVFEYAFLFITRIIEFAKLTSHSNQIKIKYDIMHKEKNSSFMEKKTKKLKKLDEGYTQILLEDMNSNIKLIAEQHSTTQQKIDRIEIKVDKLELDVDVIKSVVISHSRDIKEMKADIGTLKSDVKRIEQKLDDSLDANEKRIQKIEEKVFI